MNILQFSFPKSCLQLLLLAICVISISTLNAQANNIGKDKSSAAGIIIGKVVDEYSMPIPGVKIVNTTTKIIAETDIDGEFNIAAKPDNEIEVSFHDLIPQNVKIKDFDKLEIVLASSLIDPYATLGCYPKKVTVATVATPVKLSMPDQNFFSRLLYYISTVVR